MASTEKLAADEHLLYQLLCLLEVPEAAAKQNVELVPSSFRRANNKGLEFVLYQMYGAIHGQHAAEKEFKFILSMGDKNQSSKEFTQKMSDWFKQLKDRYQLESLASMTASQLKSATGHRVVSTLLELATLALQVQYQRLAPHGAAQYTSKLPAEKDCKVLPQLESVVRDVAVINLQKQVQRFLQLTRQASELQARHEQDAKELCDQYYSARATHQRVTATGSQQDTVDCSGSLWDQYQTQTQGQGQGTHTPPSLLLEPVQLPSAVSGQIRELQTLDMHLAQYKQIGDLLASTVTSSVHPYAIDGQALHAAMHPSTGSARQSRVLEAEQSVDVVHMVDQWVDGLEQVAEALESLTAGSMSGDALHMSQQITRLGNHRLLAPPSDSSGHAALLGTQLRVHRDGEAQLQDMIVQLKRRILETDEQLVKLRPQVLAGSERIAISAATCGPSIAHAPRSSASTSPLARPRSVEVSSVSSQFRSRRKSLGYPGQSPAASRASTRSESKMSQDDSQGLSQQLHDMVVLGSPTSWLSSSMACDDMDTS